MLQIILFVFFLSIQSIGQAQNYTEKSFLFLWPNQNEDAARLNLDEPLVADRPDFTEASSAVGKNVLQIESGYTFNYQEADSGREIEHSYPEVLIRKGFYADWLELRLATNFSSFDSKGDSRTRYNDLYLGTKVGIVPQDNLLPEFSIFPQMTLPVGDFGSDHILPGVNFSYSWGFLEDSYIGMNTQINRTEEDSRVFTEYTQSVAIGTALTEDTGVYIEWFALFPDSRSSNDQHFANGGVTYFLTKDTMFDIRYGHSIDQKDSQFFLGSGLTLRFL